ncbi:MAG: hypothetical protein WDN30_09705 [Pararobbsia sp.]
MQAGRRDEALHELDRCRRALARELDAEPQPATLALFELRDGSQAAGHPAKAAGLSRADALPVSAAGSPRAAAAPVSPAGVSPYGLSSSAFNAAPRGTGRRAGRPAALRSPSGNMAGAARAHARLAMGIAHLLRDRFVSAALAFEGALLAQPDDVIDLSLGSDARTMALSLLAVTHWREGQATAATEAAARAVERARRIGEPVTLARALLGAGVLCQLRADAEHTLDYTAEILDIAEQNALPAWKLPRPPCRDGRWPRSATPTASTMRKPRRACSPPRWR